MKTMIASLAVLTCLTAQAGNGVKGGDPARARMIRIYKSIQGELAAVTRAYLAMRFTNLDTVGDTKVKAELLDLKTRGILSDIRKETYKPQDEGCLDESGEPQPATTKQGSLGADICYGVKALASENARLPDLIGLAVHEHARHLGYDDFDHTLMEFVIEDSADFADRFMNSFKDDGVWSRLVPRPHRGAHTSTVSFDNFELEIEVELSSGSISVELCRDYKDQPVCQAAAEIKNPAPRTRLKLVLDSKFMGGYLSLSMRSWSRQEDLMTFQLKLLQNGQLIPSGMAAGNSMVGGKGGLKLAYVWMKLVPDLR